jgi:hypothetical protein
LDFMKWIKEMNFLLLDCVLSSVEAFLPLHHHLFQATQLYWIADSRNQTKP